MENRIYTPLQLRELFHLEFLRWLGRKIKADSYALKGGANLRFFFKSFRYSEDMDLDARNIRVDMLKDTVMDILCSPSFRDILRPFGIDEIVPPDMSKAKQIETTQRFKVHLLTPKGEDHFSKIEFSRRGFKGKVLVQPVSEVILRAYKFSPLLVPHYDVYSAVAQKVDALASRTILQARDVFDLYVLSSQYESRAGKGILQKAAIKRAYENIFAIGFEQFRDTVILYLSDEDQAVYGLPSVWDEIKLKTAHFLEELLK